jgi:hypothetical protein
MFFDFTTLRSSYENPSTGSGRDFCAQDDQKKYRIRRKRTFGIEQGIQNLEVEIAALRSQ